MNRTGVTLPMLLATRTAQIHLWQGRGRVLTWSACELRDNVDRWAKTLRAHGAHTGSVVATSAPTSLNLIAAILGAWHCGAAVAVLPEMVAQSAPSLRRVAEGLQQVQAQILLVDGELVTELPVGVSCLLQLGSAQRHDARQPVASPNAATPDGLALLQLTSGSQGTAKIVPISHDMLALNCMAVQARIGVHADDHMVTWLPLTHDMGFSGALGQSLASNCALTLLPTALFSRSPLSLLHALSDQKATLSPNPPSAYELLGRLGARAARESLDLSRWRYAWVGAEPVFASVLHAFEAAMRPLGLQDNVLQPAYGMAEAVVAVSFSPAGQRWRALRLQAKALREQGKVIPVREPKSGDLVSIPPAQSVDRAEVLTLVSNGRPLDGVQLRVCGPKGIAQPLQEGQQGTLWVHGSSVADRYLDGQEAERFQTGWYDTGDLGFLWQGEVFVSGRVKDVVSRGGVKVGAHEIEAVVSAELDLRSGRVAAFACLDHGLDRELVVVVVARRFGADEQAIERRLGAAVAASCGVRVDKFCFTGKSPLPRTTSGKLRRGEVRDRWLSEGYEDEISIGEHCAQLV